MTLLTQRLLLSRLIKQTVICPKYLSYYGKNEYKWNERKVNFKATAIGLTLSGIVAYNLYKNRSNAFALALKSDEVIGEFREDLPTYSLEEVNKHTDKRSRIWVTYGRGVYDVTDFVDEHPGGDQILLAAGSSVEPFWLLYGMHETPQVRRMLERMRVGNVAHDPENAFTRDLDDPYAAEPMRHSALRPSSRKPFNAEPPPELLAAGFRTPNALFYVRNHLPVPVVDPDTYELEIEIEGSNKRKILTLDDIKKLPKYTIDVAIMCAGNRRDEMNKIKEVKGLRWGPGSISNAQWTGARLCDVLESIGITDDNQKYKHVQFEGLDVNVSNVPYGASIPLSKATDKRGDVLLAYEMNGAALPRDHGFPVRVVVPGTVGARNVKWLARVVVATDESDSHFQRFDYKGFAPSVSDKNPDWPSAPAIQELPVVSAICVPSDGDTVPVVDGFITVKGYAYSGGGHKIIRVDLSTDCGETWQVADVDEQDDSEAPRHWTWTLWSAKIPVDKSSKEVEIWSKAVDSSYNTQPETVKNVWNFRGVLNNAYHRINIKVRR